MSAVEPSGDCRPAGTADVTTVSSVPPPPETGDTDGYQKIQIRTSCGPETSQKPLLKTKMHFKELINLTTWCALLLPGIEIAQTTTAALFFYIGGLIRQDERFGESWWRFLEPRRFSEDKLS